jgi:aryl-alcohol dehydrogenase-like predicted oxidoreductase
MEPIPTRRLGESGLQAGAIGLGCMGMSWAYGPSRVDDAQSTEVIRSAPGLGVTLIDTADMYGPFINEELVGRALEPIRDEVTLATKCGLVVDDAVSFQMHRDGSPDHVREAIDASLKRLRTDRVELYQLHRVDPDVPVEETWGAMAEQVAAGKARAIGMSEATVDELTRAHAIHPVASLQSEFSLWTREPLSDVIPWCREHGAAFIPFAPLGRGFLTGAIKSTADLGGDDDFRARNPRFSAEAVDANQAIVAEVRAVAERLDATAAQVALAWVLAQYEHLVPIPGTTKLHRLEENAGSARLTLVREDLERLDSLPAAAGDRY